MAKARKESNLDATFSLAGCEWRVKNSPDISEMGYCNPSQQLIMIQAGMSEQTYAATFYHELVHAILFTMGKLDHNEEFVDAFGALLHQYVITCKPK